MEDVDVALGGKVGGSSDARGVRRRVRGRGGGKEKEAILSLADEDSNESGRSHSWMGTSQMKCASNPTARHHPPRPNPPQPPAHVSPPGVAPSIFGHPPPPPTAFLVDARPPPSKHVPAPGSTAPPAPPPLA